MRYHAIKTQRRVLISDMIPKQSGFQIKKRGRKSLSYLKWVHGNVVEHTRKDHWRSLLQQTKATCQAVRTVAQRCKEYGHDDRHNNRLADAVEVKALLSERVYKRSSSQQWERLAKVRKLGVDLLQLGHGLLCNLGLEHRCLARVESLNKCVHNLAGLFLQFRGPSVDRCSVQNKVCMEVWHTNDC